MLGKDQGVNLVIGERTLRGQPVHDERFAISPETPVVSSKIKSLHGT
jgi:hypothetical protein